MKVYVVYCQRRDEKSIEAVYANKSDAEECVNKRNPLLRGDYYWSYTVMNLE